MKKYSIIIANFFIGGITMELYKEILVQMLRKGEVKITFPELEGDLNSIVESECYKVLCEIKAVLEDMSLDDKECFWRIEKIVRIFEEAGSGCSGRHDF